MKIYRLLSAACVVAILLQGPALFTVSAQEADTPEKVETEKPEKKKDKKAKKDKPKKEKKPKAPRLHREVADFARYLQLSEDQVKALAEKGKAIDESRKAWDDANKAKLEELKKQIKEMEAERRSVHESSRSAALAEFTEEQKKTVYAKKAADGLSRRYKLDDAAKAKLTEEAITVYASAEDMRAAGRQLDASAKKMSSEETKKRDMMNRYVRDVLNGLPKTKWSKEQYAKIREIVSGKFDAMKALDQQRAAELKSMRDQIKAEVMSAN